MFGNCPREIAEMRADDPYRSEFSSSYFTYCCNLDVFADYMNFRGTGIICTIGPACGEVSTIKDIILNGMNIARFNFSHGDHDYHRKMMAAVREASDSLPSCHPVALALDTKGPEIRTGLNKNNANITLLNGGTIVLTTDDAFKTISDDKMLYVDYKSLAASIKVGQTILVADGTVVLEAVEINGSNVVCKIISGHTFGSRKNVSLPKVKIDLPALSEKDVSDIKFGMEQKVDIIFASFIRSAENVAKIRELLDTTEHGKTIKIISKIENFEGVHCIEEIIDASDGIMVARGDLGMDLELERVIVAQKKIMALCVLKGKPVICATQMLESMINNFRPTRAEVADVTNAVLDGADCVMLSGESAGGKYPVQAVKMMHSICHAAEKMFFSRGFYNDVKDCFPLMDEEMASAMSSVSVSYKLKAGAIVVLSTTGTTARLISQFRPRCPIIMVTRTDYVARQAHLYRNVFPLHYKEPRCPTTWSDDVDARFKFGVSYGCQKGYLVPGSKVVLVSGWKSGPGSSNCIRIVKLDDCCHVVGL